MAAEKALYSLTKNAARLSQRLSENVAEHTRDSGLIDSFASGTGGGAGKYLENGAVVTPAGIEQTKKLLASRRESDKMEGLKRVIAMMTKSLPVTSFFPLVTALLSPTTTTLQSRTLISLYITHCASTAPSLALLAINAFQKDLSDPNPVVRAGAIKTLAEMGLEDIRNLVGVAVAKGARDGSWYVRRAAGDAVRSLFRADPTPDNREALLPTLVILLNSATALTIGSALVAWEEIVPTRWDLIHPNYRNWCRILLEVEEWGQCVLLRVLVRYGRTFFLDTRNGVVDPDAELALKVAAILLNHLNPAVVCAAVKLFYYLAPPTRLEKIAKPLLRLLHSTPEVRQVVLADCTIIARENPHLLSAYMNEFFIRFDESPAVKSLRLEILVSLASESNVRLLLKEFLMYIKDSDDNFSAQAIAAIGTSAQLVPAIAEECLKALIKLSQSKNEIIITQSVEILRTLIQSPSFPATVSKASIITRLVLLLENGKIKSPTARADIFWLVGQFAEVGTIGEIVGPDLVRIGAKGFIEESTEAKLQLLTLSAKLLTLSHLSSTQANHRTLNQLFNYLTTLSRYDLSYTIRDRARFLRGILSSAGIGLINSSGEEGARVELEVEEFKRGTEVGEIEGTGVGEVVERGLSAMQVKGVLFDGKDFGFSTTLTKKSEQLSTISLLLPQKRFQFSSPLPSFPTSVPPSSIRDSLPSTTSALRSASSNSGSSTPRLNGAGGTTMRGFGSDSLSSSRNSPSSHSRGGGGKVVLVPTNYSKQDSEDEEGEEDEGAIYDQGFDVIPGSNTSAMKKGKKGGFLDLDDFYADDSAPGTPTAEVEEEEEEEESEEESGEEEESEEESDEEESGSEVGGGESGQNGVLGVGDDQEEAAERERTS